jgi:hypothetical protein
MDPTDPAESVVKGTSARPEGRKVIPHGTRRPGANDRFTRGDAA